MSARPRALRFAAELADAERRIAEALPEIVDGLIARARAGDVKAAVYLLDRLLGRAAGSRSAAADDREMPYDEEAFRLEQAGRECRAIVRRIVIPGVDDRHRAAPQPPPVRVTSGASEGA